MLIKGLVDEDFVNYKVPSMYVIMPFCSFKCDIESGTNICQNSSLQNEPNISVGSKELIDRYDSNDISRAIVFGGLEPFDSEEDLHTFIMLFREKHFDPIVIYTGFTEEEVKEKFNWIFMYENITVKFGRFIPNQEGHFDQVLGVRLASPNQYAKKIS